MDTQKNPLNETVLLKHPKHMFKRMGKKIFTSLRSKFLFMFHLLFLPCKLSLFCFLIFAYSIKFRIITPFSIHNTDPLHPIHLHDFTYYSEMENSVNADQLTSSDLDLH